MKLARPLPRIDLGKFENILSTKKPDQTIGQQEQIIESKKWNLKVTVIISAIVAVVVMIVLNLFSFIHFVNRTS
jgi:hypothetical protein